MGNKQLILKGMALAFFASAYADQAEDCEQPLSGEIMDQLPELIDDSAIHAAITLYCQFENRLNGFHGSEDDGNNILLTGAFVFLHGIDCMEGTNEAEKHTNFGHYAAMQAMGHGVGLDDYDVAHHISDHVPYIEFGSYSLQCDYFIDESEDYKRANISR